MKKILVIVLCIILAVALVGCSAADKAYEEAKKVLAEGDSQFYEIASDDSYIKIDTNPSDEEKYYNADAIQLVKDVNSALGFSESLYEKMGQTRALDGRQTDENDNFSVSWSYHPNKGLNVMYEKK